MKEAQRRGSEKKPGVLETRTAKTSSAESSNSSVSHSRGPPVKVGGPRPCGWKDMGLKILILLRALIFVSQTP